MKVVTFSSKQTIELGTRFSRILETKDVVLLEGDLGGGKTTFVKGILKGFNSSQPVLSPSFTLVREYKVKRGRVYHIDLYRIDKLRDVFSLGIEDYLYGEGCIVLVEWGEKLEGILPRYLKIKFSYLGENQRKIIFSAKGYLKRKAERLKEIIKSEV